jgi:hypothetical protein
VQAEQQMLGADVVVLKLAGFVLGEHDNVPSPVGKSLEHMTRL